MPVRSLHSSVVVWPDAKMVDQAVRRWAEEMTAERPQVLRVGYFGSYARGDWGVGSDLDLVLVVERAEEPFELRAARWDVTRLPVPAEALVYTALEWESVAASTRFGQALAREAVWVYEKG